MKSYKFALMVIFPLADLNEDEKMNMRAAFLKKKPREYHRRGLTTKNGVNPQNHIKLKRIIDADENSEMAQGGVDDSQQPKRKLQFAICLCFLEFLIFPLACLFIFLL